jgi:hypothetical protein
MPKLTAHVWLDSVDIRSAIVLPSQRSASKAMNRYSVVSKLVCGSTRIESVILLVVAYAGMDRARVQEKLIQDEILRGRERQDTVAKGGGQWIP